MFELPFPLIYIGDSLLSLVLPAFVRLFVIAGALSGLSMVLYKYLSPQQRLSAIKKEGAELNRKLIASMDSEFNVVLGLSKRSLSLNLRRLGLTMPGVLLASFPVIVYFLYAWQYYDRTWLPHGAVMECRIEPVDVELQETERITRTAPGVYSVVIFDPSDLVMLESKDDKRTVLKLSPSRPDPPLAVWTVPSLATRILGSPEGRLDPASPVKRLVLDLPRREVLPFGPSWLRHWLVPFILGAVVGSLLVKKYMGIV